MSPLSEKYRAKGKLRRVTCPKCQRSIRTEMNIPRCRTCGSYLKN